MSETLNSAFIVVLMWLFSSNSVWWSG